ncbi:MAG: hypothetical protein JW844_07875 [Candidatus Omnitrophica bacterium]|nr:hypothetical protein [Candidatus Omnitrophota bacterium]
MKKKISIVLYTFILFVISASLILTLIVPETFDYIYGYFLFRKIGNNLTVNIKNDFDKAANVAFWVFDTIKALEPYQRSRFMPVIDDNFLNIYRRGFGYCDQSAHVYATMMSWLGFETRLLMLKKEDGTSPHTVALVKVNNTFMVVDTYFGFIFADSQKNPVALDKLEGSPVFDDYINMINVRRAAQGRDKIELKASWFKNGIYFETFPYIKDMNAGVIYKRLLDKLRR